MKRVKIIVIGAGSRGTRYAEYALGNPDKLKVVGVAEPRDCFRDNLAEKHNIPKENVYSDWKDLVKREKFADAVIISTQDNMHTDPVVAFAAKGYHILLEKPMAPNPEDCRKIAAAAKKSGKIFAVCHVMRYSQYTRKLKAILDSGKIGEIVSMQHLEPVGHWHQAHSFVRGNWNKEEESSSMLLAKSCHDLDWIHYIMGEKCKSLSSFGSLFHFCRENQPENAADRCVECGIEAKCPYSAVRIYLERIKDGNKGWPVDVLTTDLTEEGVAKALKEGPYGRCVYACDNDVVDHQVVNMEFEEGQTATFTMTAFSRKGHRRTKIFGTKGEISGNGEKISIFDFLTEETIVINISAGDSSITGGHGGGDHELMKSFTAAVGNNDPSKILSGINETLESHLMVFIAEQARKNHRVMEM